VLPVLAESEPEEQTCSACSCCQPTQLAETLHHVTVNIVDGEALLQIEPLLLPETGCGACSEDQGCTSGCEPANIQYTVLEQEENHTVILLTYEVNGTTFEVIIAETLLWSYNERADEVNRTARFVSTEITAEGMSMQFYSFSYIVQHAEYNLTLYTTLTPLNSETYNTSLTIMNYAPAGKSGLTSLEFVEFNSSVTLSQQYAILGKVAKEIGKVYEKSDDETLVQFAEGYYTIEEEAKGLSKLVEKQLQEYNKEILQSLAWLMDQCPPGTIELCGALCGVLSMLCSVIYLAVAPTGFGYIICLIGCYAGFGAFCTWLCNAICGQWTTVKEAGCGAACGIICGPCPWYLQPTCILCGTICMEICMVLFQ